MKLLIIEDEASLQELMTLTLKKEGYIVENAMDYADAMDKLGGYSYDCVLLDINLPGGSGLDILEHIKKSCSQLNVIIISARDSIDDKVRCCALSRSARIKSYTSRTVARARPSV